MKTQTYSALLLVSLLAACGGGGGGGNSASSSSGGGEQSRGADPFVFATAPITSYARVDRMGGPVTATVLLPTSMKDAFNASNPNNDSDYAPTMVGVLKKIHFELDDDLIAAGLKPCELNQCVGQAVGIPAIIPDMLSLKLDQPDGYPNGRRFADSSVDTLLAYALLDLTSTNGCGGGPCTKSTLATLPLNPPSNDKVFEVDFPYLGLPQPTP